MNKVFPHVVHSRPDLTRVLASAMLTLGLATWLACSTTSFPNQRRLAPAQLRGEEAMAEIPAGEFIMGSPHGDPDEYPPHRVQVRSFRIDRVEVRWEDYLRCIRAEVCTPLPREKEKTADEHSAHPVSGVNWFAAQRYCAWLGKRLPSELEWEYAARAPSFGPFPWRGPFDAAFVNGRGAQDGFEQSAPVGSFPAGASGHGLMDMAGNVAEWTSDEYRHDRYALRQSGEEQNEQATPADVNAAMRKKVVRGGSWADGPHGLRSTDRAALDPRLSKNSVGFRCVADPE